ncbi:MAG: TolC family protein [Alphaproteobacteria bacterium]|nr:TolC family protein [Alphaproteobacteria bacterium]
MMRAALFVMTLIFLAGCAEFREHALPSAPSGYKETDLMAVANKRFNDAPPVMYWWNELKDEQLKILIQEALDNNKNVAVALANLQEARAIASETGYDRFPTVEANASYARQRSATESTIARDRTTNAYQAGFDASWEIDILGRVSESIAAAEADTQEAQETLRALAVTTASDVARAYSQLRGAQHRLDIARRNVKNQEETYNLTRRLSEGGRSNALDEARAKTQLELTRSTLPALEAEVAANIHRLSVLTGAVPDALRDELEAHKPLPSIPDVVSVGRSEDLLRARPDIWAAERNLAASIARYNVAVADLYPSVNIVGTLGFVASSLSSFGTGAAVASTIGPSINWAAFNLGRVQALIDQRDAQAQAALANYESVVLESLEELQTAIVRFSQEEKRRRTLQQAAKSSAEAARLAHARFEGGVDSFLNVLDAERTQLEAEDTLALSDIDTVLNLIAVYKALGGGWQALPSEQSESAPAKDDVE